MFPIAFSDFVHPVGHYNAHRKEVVRWAESAGREVALQHQLDVKVMMHRVDRSMLTLY